MHNLKKKRKNLDTIKKKFQDRNVDFDILDFSRKVKKDVYKIIKGPNDSFKNHYLLGNLIILSFLQSFYYY